MAKKRKIVKMEKNTDNNPVEDTQEGINGAEQEIEVKESNIVDIVTEKAEVTTLTHITDEMKVPNGYVVFVELDIAGNESNPNTVGIKTWDKVFAPAKHKGTDKHQYKLKKK